MINLFIIQYNNNKIKNEIIRRIERERDLVIR
jgi:hypothetical protein